MPNLRHYIRLVEAPLADFDAVGDLDTEGTFRPDDLRAIRNPAWREKVKNAFKQTPYTFNVYVYNGLNGSAPVGQHGSDVDTRDLQKIAAFAGVHPISVVGRLIGKTPPDAATSITVVLVENEGSERLPLTPWILAHRIGHAIFYAGQADESNPHGDRGMREKIRMLFRLFNGMINELRDRLERSPNFGHLDYVPSNQAIYSTASVIGKMRSARLRKLASPPEFLVELFAQYLIHGAVSFNHPDLDGKGFSPIDPAEGIIPADVRGLARMANDADDFADSLKDGKLPLEPRPYYAAFDANDKMMASFSRYPRDAEQFEQRGLTIREVPVSRYQMTQYRRRLRMRQKLIDQWNEWKRSGLLDWHQPGATRSDIFAQNLVYFARQFNEEFDQLLKFCVGKALIL